MAHNLYGRRMFYTGEEPWHGIGTKLNEPATAKEAIEAAELDYEIELQPVYLTNGKEIPGTRATVRSNGQVPLGIVSDHYKIVQNVDAFSFFDNIVNTKDAIYHTAGALGKGERIWILAKLPKDIILFKEDIVKEYIVLTNSHDGTSALQMYFTPVRVVCQNTLNLSLKDHKNGISIRHVGDIQGKVKEARRALGLALDFYNTFEQQAQVLGRYPMDVKKTEGYLDRVLNVKEEESTRIRNIKDTLLSLFERGRGNDLPAVRHTAWAAYNAVTEYVDHYRTVKNSHDGSNRLKSIWFGSGAQMKERAFDEIMALVS